MNELSESDKALQKRMGIMLPLLNERQSRIYLGAEAESIGRGGISTVHKLSGASRHTGWLWTEQTGSLEKQTLMS